MSRRIKMWKAKVYLDPISYRATVSYHVILERNKSVREFSHGRGVVPAEDAL